MVTLTPEMAGNTIIAMAISYIVVLGYSIYMAYLGHKQAKVSNQMNRVIELLEVIEQNTKR